MKELLLRHPLHDEMKTPDLARRGARHLSKEAPRATEASPKKGKDVSWRYDVATNRACESDVSAREVFRLDSAPAYHGHIETTKSEDESHGRRSGGWYVLHALWCLF